MQFLPEEIDFLLTALDALEAQEGTNAALSSVFAAIFTGGDKAKMEEVKAAEDERRRTMQEEVNQKKDRCILLKAKLVTMRAEEQGRELFAAARAEKKV